MAVFLDSPGRSPFAVREWADWLAEMMLIVKSPVGFTVNLILVDDACIARLNSCVMDCPGPTNVISFPAEGAEKSLAKGGGLALAEEVGHPEFGNCNIAEIYLSLDTLKRECRLYGQALEDHAKRLLAHGLGHVLGYDHGLEMDALTDFLVEGLADG